LSIVGQGLAGLFISEEAPYIAASPDGITKCDCCGCEVVEIKCPFCTKDSDPDMARFLEDDCLPTDH